MEQSILEKLEKIEQLLNKPIEKENMTIEQAAEHTTFSVSTLYGYVNKRQIPFRKKHGKLVFRRKELDAWLDEGFQAPIQIGTRKIGNKRVTLKL